jgi:hypothetical protein
MFNFKDPGAFFFVVIMCVSLLASLGTSVISLIYGCITSKFSDAVRLLWITGHLVLITAICHYCVWIRYVNTH